MDNGDFINRLKKIGIAKNAQSHKEEFLKTEYHIPALESLYLAIKEFAASLKGHNLHFKIYYDTDPDVVDDWTRKVSGSCEHLSFSIIYRIGYYVQITDDSNEDYGQYDHIPTHNFTTGDFNYLTQEGTEGDLELTINDNLEPLWNGYNNNEFAKEIFLWFIENMEEYYGVPDS